MSHFRILGVPAIVCASVLMVGCNGNVASIVSPSPLSASARDIRARENSHHEFALRTPGVQAMRQESSRYFVDMRDLMASMMTACKSMGSMGTGMMGGHSSENMQRMLDRMRQAVGAHESRLSGMRDMMAMRAECSAHHDQMAGMLSEMDQMMSGDHDSHHGS